MDKRVEAGKFISDNGKNQHDLINAEYNYYEGIDLTEDMFSGVAVMIMLMLLKQKYQFLMTLVKSLLLNYR